MIFVVSTLSKTRFFMPTLVLHQSNPVARRYGNNSCFALKIRKKILTRMGPTVIRCSGKFDNQELSGVCVVNKTHRKFNASYSLRRKDA
jgi:hypothetical protein